ARVLPETMPLLDLERLYNRHASALFAFLLTLTRNEADTRDLMQELFTKLARQPALLQGVRDERAFLLRLSAPNLVNDHLVFAKEFLVAPSKVHLKLANAQATVDFA